jgi:hypothetical protein
VSPDRCTLPTRHAGRCRTADGREWQHPTWCEISGVDRPPDPVCSATYHARSAERDCPTCKAVVRGEGECRWCERGLVAPLPALAPPKPNLWPRLIAMAEANVQPAPTMDVRQLAAAKARCARLVEMLRGRATEAGPVTEVPEAAAIAGVIDALLGLFALWASAPPKARPVLQGLVDAQLRVVLTLSAISQPAEPPARGEG